MQPVTETESFLAGKRNCFTNHAGQLGFYTCTSLIMIILLQLPGSRFNVSSYQHLLNLSFCCSAKFEKSSYRIYTVAPYCSAVFCVGLEPSNACKYRLCMMSSMSNDNSGCYSAASDQKLLELLGYEPATDPACAELTVEELRSQNEQLRQYVVKLLDESDQLKRRLKESESENHQLELKLSNAEAVELEHYDVLEL